MIEKRAVYRVTEPFVWDCDWFYLVYNKKTNRLYSSDDKPFDHYDLDDVIIMWDGKDREYYRAHPKQFVDVYQSNSDKPEEGYVFVGKEAYGDLPYYYRRDWRKNKI